MRSKIAFVLYWAIILIFSLIALLLVAALACGIWAMMTHGDTADMVIISSVLAMLALPALCVVLEWASDNKDQ